MGGQKKQKTGIIIQCLALILALFVSVPMAMGQEKTIETKQAPIKQPKKLGYQDSGYVLRVGEEEIVVDDRLFKIAKQAKYHASGDGALISKKMNEGTFIGFNLNEKKEITDIWILKRK